MKKYLALVLLFLFFSNSNYGEFKNSIIDITLLQQEYLQDKIGYISIEESENNLYANIDQFDKKLLELTQQDYNAVILGTNYFSTAILNSSNKALSTLKKYVEKVKSRKLFSFVEVNFSDFSRSSIDQLLRTGIKRSIKELIQTCELDGLYFSGINYNSEIDAQLLQELIVECMMIKPFLSISISKKDYLTNISLTESFLKTGIIDFVLDDRLNYSILANHIYENGKEKILPTYLKRLQPDNFITLNLSTIIKKPTTSVTLLNDERELFPDSNYEINFITSQRVNNIKLRIGSQVYNIPTRDWVIPFKYKVNKDTTTVRYGTWIEFRRPFEKHTTSDTYSLLCRTSYPSEVYINGSSVKIYKTGVFFKKIKLIEGMNPIRAQVKSPDGTTVIYEDCVLYQKKKTIVDAQLTIYDDPIQPSGYLELTKDDLLTILFNGTKSQRGFVELLPANLSYECLREDIGELSRYRIQIPLENFPLGEVNNIKLILKSADETNQQQVEKTLQHTFIVKDKKDFPLIKTIDNNSILYFTLAPIRLGAPIRNELPKNVLLRSDGIFGDYYRIKLNDNEEGYINKEFVKEEQKNSIAPNYFINPIIGSASENADVVRIPYPESVPYDIYPDPYQKRIIITLYGVQSSSTWIIHRNEMKFIEEITWQQTSKETYKIYINLKTPKIWGYEITPNGKELVFRIKYPPKFNLGNRKPLTGIKISIEAGHGGTNYGAVGLSGLKEKDINLDLSKKIETIFKKYGAEVFQVRDSDKDMLLLGKRNDAVNSGANLHLSIHANSSDPPNEFLGTSGTCTFYHNPFWAPFAEKVFNKLIDLKLKPFGSVGSFNYRVTRMSEMPSILVEQAFMSHAEDEEKLADNNFRVKMAQKIYEGLINYLKYMKE